MAQGYRVEVGVGPTFDLLLTDANDLTLSIDCDLRKEKSRISNLTIKVYDPDWVYFNRIKDPAYNNIPVRLLLSEFGNVNSIQRVVFQGKVTSLQAGFPAVSTTTIVAHDQTIDARKRARYKTYANLTSLELAKKIANDNGLVLESTDGLLGDVKLTRRAVEIAASGTNNGQLSDWDFMSRALSADGLELFLNHSTGKLTVRLAAKLKYPTVFRRDTAPVEKLDVQINHIGGPGEGGNKETVTTLVTSAVQIPKRDKLAGEATKEKAEGRTSRTPLSGNNSDNNDAHSEAKPSAGPYGNKVAEKRKRKDTATLVCSILNDIRLEHFVMLAGWGGKADGKWYIESIRHSLIGSDHASTILSLQRETAEGSSGASGLPFIDANVNL